MKYYSSPTNVLRENGNGSISYWSTSDDVDDMQVYHTWVKETYQHIHADEVPVPDTFLLLRGFSMALDD
tara:strand:+ start:180 stop:386 length:207 start_codon:yes stop_codon:yes gene_type:complete